MRRLLHTGLYLLFLALVCQAQYEVTEHLHRSWGFCLPGWEGAVYAERITLWRPRTGLPPIDRLIHEGTEAGRYYRWLLTGSPHLTLASNLELSQNG